MRINDNLTWQGKPPKCNCEEPGEVRPNIQFSNDPDWNTSRSDS